MHGCSFKELTLRYMNFLSPIDVSIRQSYSCLKPFLTSRHYFPYLISRRFIHKHNANNKRKKCYLISVKLRYFEGIFQVFRRVY